MRTIIAVCLLLAAGCTALPGQQDEAAVASRLVVPDGAPVRLRLGRTVSSAEAHVGDRVDFIVVEDLAIGGALVIPRGSIAVGTITEVKCKHLLARGGKLALSVGSVRLTDGNQIPLRATKEAKGGGHTGLMAGAMIGTGLVFLPAAPVFALMHGQDSTILKGTEVTAYVQGDFSLERKNLPTQTASGASDEKQLPALTQIVHLLPNRVLDREGNEGDAVNLITVASQAELEAAFARAGWIQVDRSRQKAALHLVTERGSYRGMPMSNLFLFGRRQDYSYAIAESTVSRRHHLRIWKTDYEIDGRPVWVGAATHDIGLERNRRGFVTHKIDPNVDEERDFIASSLRQTHLTQRIGYVRPTDAVSEAYTATGGRYYSDGRVLLIELE